MHAGYAQLLLIEGGCFGLSQSWLLHAETSSDLLKRHETISHPLGQGVLQDTEPSTEERVPESQEAVLAYELGESPVNALDSFLGTELQDLNLASNSAMQLL